MHWTHFEIHRYNLLISFLFLLELQDLSVGEFFIILLYHIFVSPNGLSSAFLFSCHTFECFGLLKLAFKTAKLSLEAEHGNDIAVP